MDMYSNLNFERQPRTFPRRTISIGITIVVFSLLWFFAPRDVLFWLLLISLAALVWIGSYGWRMALAALIGFLRRLENF